MIVDSLSSLAVGKHPGGILCSSFTEEIVANIHQDQFDVGVSGTPLKLGPF